jgi:membrane associated rhomboid family serine protease
MGIYDRDYVRREGPSFLGSFVERGQVCKWLVGINIAAFIVQVLTLPPFDSDSTSLGWFTDALDLKVSAVLHGQFWRLLTYAFLHDPNGIMHILFNMLFLWWFGTDVEDLYGPREFLTYYLSACFASGLLYFLSSLAWMPQAGSCLGASGGVLAVLVLCAIHYPMRTILLFFILPVPLWLFLIIFLAGDAYVFLKQIENSRKDIGSTTAVAAHLGGALFAGVYYRLHIRLIDWVPQFWNAGYWRGQVQSWRRRLFGPRLRLYKDEKEHETPPRSPAPRGSVRRPSSASAEAIYRSDEGTQQSVAAGVADEHLEAKMDAILEKISRVGKENLTESEREFLVRASEIFRRRRT